MASPGAPERELRAKYLDWCSARLADQFLALSPDEIYELAERASHGREPDAGAVVASGASSPGRAESPEWSTARHVSEAWREPETFRVLVARVAEVLADTLPTFEEWARAYAESPQQFDDELLGFWKENL